VAQYLTFILTNLAINKKYVFSIWNKLTLAKFLIIKVKVIG